MTNPLKVKMKDDPAPALHRILGGVRRQRLCQPSLDIDERTTPVVVRRDERYNFSASVNLARSYATLLDAWVEDYGIELNGALERRPEKRYAEIFLELDAVDHRNPTVHLRGSFHHDAYEFERLGNGFKVDLVTVGIPRSTALLAYQELILEALITQEMSAKLALFSYVAAIESLIAMSVEAIARSLHSTLRYPIERLSMGDKLVLVAETLHPSHRLHALPVGSELKEMVKRSVDVRNEIAHSRKPLRVSEKNLFDAKFALAMTYGLLEQKLTTFKDMRKFFYP